MSTSDKKIIVVLIFTMLVGTFFFLGKMRFLSNPIVRYVSREFFVRNVVESGKIDAERFWEFRDIYADKPIVFKQENIIEDKPFLILSTSAIQSLDYLLLPDSKTIKTFVIPSEANIIFKSKNEIVFRDGKKLIIKFVKEIPEMETANGFFSYFGVDLKPYSDRLWYNETIIDE